MIFPETSVLNDLITWQTGTIALTTFLAGAFEGMAETLKFHFSLTRKWKWLYNNYQFWNPQVSWINKYQDNNPAKGPKFRWSTTALVFLTDGYHLTRQLRNICLMTSIALAMALPIQIVDFGAFMGMFLSLYLVFTGGFSVVYSYIFKG